MDARARMNESPPRSSGTVADTRRHVRSYIPTVLLLALGCAGGSGESGGVATDASGTDDDGDDAGSVGEGGEGADETGAPPEAAFISDFDLGGPNFECSPWLEGPFTVSDCPSGEKCAPIATDGGPVWNATACVDIAPNPAGVGDPCTASPLGTAGDDDCEQGAVCWNVDGSGNGTCVATCSLDFPFVHEPAEAHCLSAEGVHCISANGGVLALCLPTCNPTPTAVSSGCSAGEGCYPIHHGFACAVASGPPTAPTPNELGDPCEHSNECGVGLFCLDSALQPACAGDRCCAEYCDVTETSPCTDAGSECIPWYDEGTDIPDVADLGFCAATGFPVYSELGFGEPSAWNCIASLALVAVETSCSGEPISGECGTSDVEQNLVALPQVDDGQSGTFSGWVVQADWVDDPIDPTAEDELGILERCVSACELEYAENPFVSATCSAGAFLEPTLRARSSTGPLVAVPMQHIDGSDLFLGESVECDLRGDCSAAFDEELAPARLQRVSPAAEPLHRGEEWVVGAIGQMHAHSSYAAVVSSADIDAVIGYSRCAAGNDSTCPFYLGSMELELLEPLALELECDSAQQVHELTELTIRLAQPAFGVAEQGTTWNAFPPGGLVLEADGVVDEVPFSSRRPIEEPVFLDAADGLLWFQGLHGFKVDFQVPCNGLLADVDVWWQLEDDEVLEGPPSLGIGHLPSTIACPDDLPLTLAWSADPEEDYASLRWIVDGVLLEETWPTISFTEAHEITAVLRDARGATGRATKTIFCE